MSDLRYLGHTASTPIDAGRVDTIPVSSHVDTVTYETTELAALCPVTEQPDLYHATITYRPEALSLESKALKLYLVGFRNRGIFCEDLAALLADDLSGVLGVPVAVTLRQQVRGGLALIATATGATA